MGETRNKASRGSGKKAQEEIARKEAKTGLSREKTLFLGRSCLSVFQAEVLLASKAGLKPVSGTENPSEIQVSRSLAQVNSGLVKPCRAKF